MAPARPTILRSTALVMGLALLAKATGLLREVIVASWFGTSPEMDAFIVAGTIASLIFVWIHNPIQVVVVPLFTQQLTAHGERSAWQGASVIMNTLVLVLIVLVAVGWILSPQLVSLVAPGFADSNQGLAANLTRIMLLTVVLLGVAKLLSAFLYSYQRFGRPGMTSTVDNLVIIPSIVLLAPVLGIHSLAVSAIVGAVAQVLVQAPVVWRNRHHYTTGLDFRNPILHRMGRMSLPLLVGTGSAGLSKISDRIFASLLQSGSLSALAYGHQLTYATFQLFVSPLTTVLFPALARTAGRRDYHTLGQSLFKSLKVLFWLVLPISLGIVLLSQPLVRLIYHRGAFNEESVALTSQAVLFYAIGLSAYSLSNVLSYGFYSLQDTKTPVMAGIVRLAIKILLSFTLVGRMGHAGLALAESLSFVAKAALLLYAVPRSLRHAEYRGLVQSFGVTGAATALMGAVVFSSLPYVGSLFESGLPWLATVLGLAVPTMLGMGSYLIFSILLRPVELKDLYRSARAGFATVKG